jgi:hypothetical protein
MILGISILAKICLIWVDLSIKKFCFQLNKKSPLTPLAFQAKNLSRRSRLTRYLAIAINQCDTIRYHKQKGIGGKPTQPQRDDWNAKNKSMKLAKKKKLAANTYTYFVHEIQSGKNEGDIMVKRYGNINTDDEIIESKKSPPEIHQQQQLYNKGLIGISDRTGLDYYAETIEYGRQGG